MRKLKLFLACMLMTIFSIGQVWADSYTITFKDSGTDSDNSTKRTAIADIISDGASYVSSLSDVSNVYQARTGRGIKLGTSNASGALTLNLAEKVKATSIVVRAMRYKDGEATLKIQDKTNYTLTAAAADYTYTYNAATDITSIVLGSTSKRNYIISVTVNYESGSSTPTLSVSPKSWDFGEVAASDVASKVFSVSGSNLETGTLTISVPSGFSVSPSSISVSEATLAATEVTVSKNTTTINDYSGNLSISGCGLAEAKTVALEMSVVADPEPTGTFALFSGDIEEGDYVIYYGGKALQASITSDRWGCLNVTPAENKITNPDASIIWHIAASDDNWTLYNAKEEKYAASTGAKNKGALIADGTDEKAIWSVSGTYDFINVARSTGSDPNNKYLRYNSQNADNSSWACYASGTGGALTLYQKQVAGKPATPAITGEISFLSSTEVTMTCATEGATIYYTTTESAKETPATSGDWTAYDSENKPSFSATTTVWAAAKKDDNWSSVAEKTFTKIVPLTTMDEIFARAKEVKSTATDVYVTFNNWTISGVTSTNAYLTDGTKGLIIYANSHGFTANKVLSGTVPCKVQLYQGSAELTSLTASTEGLTVSDGVAPTATEKTIAELDSINTGAVVTVKNVTCTDAENNDVVDDASNTMRVYKQIYSQTLVEGKKYNITGVFKGGTYKNIYPRSAEDVERIKDNPDISWSNSGAAVNVHIDNTDDLPTLTKGGFTVTCSSSDEDVATVDNDGVVTMVGAGTTTISAVFAGDDDYKAKTVSYELTVLPDFYIAGNFTSWGDNKIPVAGESKTINLTAGSYELKVVTTADEWKGFENLDAATVVSGIYTTDGGDANICFKLDAASNVTVSYVGGKISLVGNFAEQEIKVAGDAPFTWDGAVLELAENKLTASKTFTALEAKSYAVKMINGGSWLGNGGTINRENPSTVIVVNGDNMSFVADMAGDYTFTWTFATRTLTVTYPALPEKEYYVAGSFTNWETGKVKMTTTDDETWTATVALEADKTGANKYEFKIIETQLADTWLGLNSAASMVYGNCTDWTIGGGGENIGLETTKAADYTFTYVPATKKLSVNIPQKDAGLAWNASTATAYTVGKEYELPTLSNPNGLMVELSSSNEAVAYLDEGQLKIAGAGTATITATSAATGVYAAGEATYTLTVSAPTSVAVSGSCETDYEKGADFVRTGLVATAKYDDASELDVTASATWTNSLTDNKVNAAGDVTVTAEWESLSGNKVVTVSLLTHELTFSAPTNGTLVVEYNDEAVATDDHFVKGDVLTITATPASIDYKLASLTVNGEAFTSGSTYTVGTEDIAIVASFTKKPEPTLSWSIDPNNPKNVYLSGRDEDNEFPTAINPQSLPLTYGSLNGSVAEIDAKGNFILHEAGFASMYFNFAGNETYCSVHREYPLTVYALDRIEIGGEATATEYEAGDAFDRSGLTATAVYKVGAFTENYDVTTKATWNAAPATIAAATESVSVTAAWNGKTSAAEEVAVTVKTHKVIFDANKNHVYLSVWNGETQISSGDEFAKGTVLTVEVGLESADYVLATLTANTTDIKATKQFTIGEVDVTIEATSESKPVAPISWSAESASIAMNGDVATLPTLVNELGLGIRYMNNNEEAATIDENTGVITLVGPGEATILAVYVATPESQYRTTLAEYTLTVTAATYAVTFEAPTNGSLEILNGEDAVASGAEFVAGTELTITATADQGYKLSSLTVNGEDFVSGETYTMGAQAVVVVATFVQDSGTTIDNAEAGEKAQKIMLNNQLFILRGGKIYDAQGKLVK